MAKGLRDAELARAVANARDTYARLRRVVDLPVLPEATDQERADVARATRVALLRIASFTSYLPTPVDVLGQLMMATFYGLVCVLITVPAYMALREFIPLFPLALSTSSGSGLAWVIWSLRLDLAYDEDEGNDEAESGKDEGSNFVVMLWRVTLRFISERDWLRLSWVFTGVAVCPAAAAGAFYYLVDAHRTGSLWYILVGLTCGGLAVLSLSRISSVASAVLRPLWTRHGHYRCAEQMFMALLVCAESAEAALMGHGRARWDTPLVSRELISQLRESAAGIEDFSKVSTRVPWRYGSLRSKAAAPYREVAAILRVHIPAVALAKTESDWHAICESLNTGLIAAANNDWQTLLANAPADLATRKSLLLRLARRIAPSAILASCATLLPIWVPMGAYGSSVRAVLFVSAVLGLLPEAGSTSGEITGTLSRALPFRGS